MAILSELSSFLTFLKESIKLVPKNGKLMALIAISSMLFNSCFFLLFSYSIQSLIKDMSASIMQYIMPDPAADPSTDFDPTKISAMLDNLKQYMALIFTVEIAAYLVSSIAAFFFAVAIILVSAVSYIGTTLSIKQLFSMLGKTWKRPLITTFYIAGLAIGYFVCVLALTVPLLILFPNRAAISVAVLIWIATSFLYFYLVTAWLLAVVVSVVEESCYGVQALTRASTLVKGKRFHGYLLILCFNIVGVIIFQGFNMILGNKNKSTLSTTVYGLFVVNISSLLNILFLVAYTVLYFNCKKHHGEEIEFHGSVHQYAKLPTSLLANDVDIP